MTVPRLPVTFVGPRDTSGVETPRVWPRNRADQNRGESTANTTLTRPFLQRSSRRVVSFSSGAQNDTDRNDTRWARFFDARKRRICARRAPRSNGRAFEKKGRFRRNSDAKVAVLAGVENRFFDAKKSFTRPVFPRSKHGLISYDKNRHLGKEPECRRVLTSTLILVGVFNNK